MLNRATSYTESGTLMKTKIYEGEQQKRESINSKFYPQNYCKENLVID